MFDGANAAGETTKSSVHSIHGGLIDQYPHKMNSSKRDSFVLHVEVVRLNIFVKSTYVQLWLS